MLHVVLILILKQYGKPISLCVFPCLAYSVIGTLMLPKRQHFHFSLCQISEVNKTTSPVFRRVIFFLARPQDVQEFHIFTILVFFVEERKSHTVTTALRS